MCILNLSFVSVSLLSMLLREVIIINENKNFFLWMWISGSVVNHKFIYSTYSVTYNFSYTFVWTIFYKE